MKHRSAISLSMALLLALIFAFNFQAQSKPAAKPVPMSSPSDDVQAQLSRLSLETKDSPQSDVGNPDKQNAVLVASSRAPAQGSVPRGPESPQVNPLPPERALAMKITTSFTLAAVGDILLRHSVAQLANSNFQNLIAHLRSADLAFGNMETTIVDYSNMTRQGMLSGMPKSCVPDLRAMGIRIMNCANNHSMEGGVAGLFETNAMLDEGGIVHAGTGRNLQEARMPGFLDTAKGTVGVVGVFSIAPDSSPSPSSTSAATYQVGDQAGVPGVNGLHVTQYNVVTADQMEELRKIRDSLYARREEVLYPVPPLPANEPKDRLQLFGQWYKTGPKPGELSWSMDQGDLNEILRSIKNGKEYADFMIVTIHCHENSHAIQKYTFDSDVPDFLVEFAHKAIDNGADVFIGHGVHTLRGVEIYKGKPIFYGVASFMNQPPDSLLPQSPGGSLTHAEASNLPTDAPGHEGGRLQEADNREALLATSRYEGGKLVEVKLYPADTGRDGSRPLSLQGIPMTPSPEVAQHILEKVQKVSARFGTKIVIEGNVGVIRIAGDSNDSH
jgi:poly-gamma-glutamate capsule biosynthesis protein CapA/YwtB (metallophosphatase superfamily)